MADVRPMTEDDIDFALDLTAAEGWDYSRNDILRMLRLSPGGCFVASVDGDDGGIITTTPFGEDSAFIGTLLIDLRHRGQGVGKALLDRAVGHLKDDGRESIYLEAITRVVPMYEKAGFVKLWQSLRLLGMEVCRTSDEAREAGGTFHARDGRTLEVTSCGEGDLEEVVELDRRCNGMDRTTVLGDLLADNPDISFVCREDGKLRGFLFARPQSRGFRMGPWVCEKGDEEPARALLQLVRSRIGGEKLFVGIPVNNTLGVNLLKRHGFRDGVTCVRMRLGSPEPVGEPEGIYGVISLDMG